MKRQARKSFLKAKDHTEKGKKETKTRISVPLPPSLTAIWERRLAAHKAAQRLGAGHSTHLLLMTRETQ